MDGVGRVVYVWSSIRRVLSGGQIIGAFIVFQPDGRPGLPSDDCVAAVDRAVAHANAQTPRLTLVAGAALHSPQGVLVSVFHDRARSPLIRTWLDAFAGHLDGAGRPGRVTAPGVRNPPFVSPSREVRLAPCAFVGYRPEALPPRTQWLEGWSVDADTTQRVADHAAQWASRGLPNVECWLMLSPPTVQATVEDGGLFLSSAAHLGGSTAIASYRSQEPPAESQISVTPVGQYTAGRLRPGAPWTAILADMIETLLVAPGSADVGMIKNANPGAISWQDLTSPFVYQPVRWLNDYEANRHLWAEYVIDVHAVNLLTDQHLAHATDLSDWTVEQVAPGRHLVTAKQLEPWFTGGSPPNDVLAKARADFGDMILTWDVIQARPGPYTVLDPRVVGR